MSDVIDVQTAVIGQLLDLLAAVPAFGDAVRERWWPGWPTPRTATSPNG